MTLSARQIVIGLVWIACTRSVVGAAPVIKDIIPISAAVGETIKITGSHFKRAHSVAFVVGHTLKHAKFLVKSDNELEVTVPEFYRPGAEAVILVRDQDNLAVTCPTTEIVIRDNSPKIPHDRADSKVRLLHVIRGGVVPETSLFTIIEDGGFVNAVHRSPLVVVKRGGTLVEGARSSSDLHRALNVIYEEGAHLGPEFRVSNPYWSIAGCSRISVAEGVGPFVFRAAPVRSPLDVSKAPPEITGAHPMRLAPGELLTVRGKGFSGTTEVHLLPHSSPVGFFIESDNLLRIDTPDGYMGINDHEIVVINSLGLTVTHSPQLSQPGQVGQISRPAHFLTIPSGAVMTDLDTSQLTDTIFLVEPGGTMSGRFARGTMFVRSGGAIVHQVGHVYYEPNASIPPSIIHAKLVPRIHVSRLHTGLQFTLPLPWK